MDVITLRPGGIEYVHWTATGLPADPGPISVSIDGDAWTTATLTDSTITVLAAHHSVTTPPAGAIVVPAGLYQMQVRLDDTPEVVIRDAGWIRAD